MGFALFPIFGKLALGSIPPFVFAAFRVVGAVVLLDSVRFSRTREAIRPADRKRLLLYGLLGVSFNQILFILGLSLTTAINTSIVTATIPVFTLGAAVALRREGMSLRAAAGIALAGAGAFALLNAQRFDWGSDSFRGVLLLLLNCTSYSLYLVLSRRILAHYHVATFTAAVFRYGAILIVLAAVAGPPALRPVARAGAGVGMPRRGDRLLHRDPVSPQLLGARAHARVARRVLRVPPARDHDGARHPGSRRGPHGENGDRGGPDLRGPRDHGRCGGG